jgi:hypothetical protein
MNGMDVENSGGVLLLAPGNAVAVGSGLNENAALEQQIFIISSYKLAAIRFQGNSQFYHDLPDFLNNLSSGSILDRNPT